MSALPQSRRTSVEEYLALDRNDPDHRYEYYDGDVRMMSGGTLDHAALAHNLNLAIGPLIRGGPCRFYGSDARVQIGVARFVYPDVTISCDPGDRGKVDIVRAPKVVFEVLSPSNQGYDVTKKANYYRACPSIEEIVFIHFDEPLIDRLRRAERFWELQSFVAGETVDLASVGIVFAVDDIYEGIDFTDQTPNEDAPPAP